MLLDLPGLPNESGGQHGDLHGQLRELYNGSILKEHEAVSRPSLIFDKLPSGRSKRAAYFIDITQESSCCTRYSGNQN
jgi:hypothetical protein